MTVTVSRRRWIRLVEVDAQLKPTGREIRLGDDCPLFQLAGWAPALLHGLGTVDCMTFEQLKALIDEQGPGDQPVGGSG